jgi:hypothetical protein
LATREVKRLTSAAKREHRYKRIEWGARISEGGGEWRILWRPTVVAISDDVAGVKLSSDTPDLDPGSIEESVEPTTILLERETAVRPNKLARFFRFPEPLAQGQESTFTYLRRFSKVRPLKGEDVWLARPVAGCDELVIRVIFDGMPPAEVYYRITDRADSYVAEEKRVMPDSLSGEVQRTIPFPSAALTYGFYWRYNGKA